MTKVCSKCKEKRNLEFFSKDNSGRTKVAFKAECKICQGKRHKLYRIKNLDRLKEADRAKNLKRFNNITIAEYEIMLKDQNDLCKICSRHKSEFKLRFNVDHCHKSGKIRGLLCTSCNRGLGFFRDDINLFKKAINYIEVNNEN